jgi:hypothetical protein
MRIRARHIVILVLMLITLFILYATTMHEDNAESKDPLSGLAPPIDMPMEMAPEIAVDDTHIDFGVIPSDREAKREVAVYNRGGSPLEIMEVRTSCNLCTIGYFETGKNRIAPGESSLLQIKVSPSGIYGFHSQKTLTLTCNDPRNPQMTLTVEAHVEPEYVLEPEEIDFGEVAKGIEKTTSVMFRSRIEPAVTVQSVSLSPDETTTGDTDAIAFEITPAAAAADQQPGSVEYRISATLRPEMSAGPFEIPVFIHTDLKRFSKHRILAVGTIVAPYTVTLSQTSPGLHLRGSASETVTIRSSAPVRLEDIRSEEGYFDVVLEEPETGSNLLRCVPLKELDRGVYKDALLFAVTQDGNTFTERIEVTVYAYGAASDPQKPNSETEGISP